MTPQEEKSLRAELQRTRKKNADQAREIRRLSRALEATKAHLKDKATLSQAYKYGAFKRVWLCVLGRKA